MSPRLTDVEKIYTVMELIYEKSLQLQKGEPIGVSITRLVRAGLDRFDVMDVMSMLALDENRHCINITHYPDMEQYNTNVNDDFYYVTLQEANFLWIYRNYQDAMSLPVNRQQSVLAGRTLGLAQTPRLDENSYDSSVGVLLFGGHPVYISQQKNRRGKHLETNEAKLMRALFKSVNSMKNGIPFYLAASVRYNEFNAKKCKRAKNYIARINQKVSAATPGNQNIELIIFNQERVMVNSLYLLS